MLKKKKNTKHVICVDWNRDLGASVVFKRQQLENLCHSMMQPCHLNFPDNKQVFKVHRI